MVSDVASEQSPVHVLVPRSTTNIAVPLSQRINNYWYNTHTQRHLNMPSATKASSRSPSPPAAPPVAESPGPRATALINVFNNAHDATLKKCSYNSFAACFPTAAQYVPETVDQMWRDFTGQLGRTWKDDFEGILAERDVVRSLNSLDQCINDAKKRKERAEKEANGAPVEAPIPYASVAQLNPLQSQLLTT